MQIVGRKHRGPQTAKIIKDFNDKFKIIIFTEKQFSLGEGAFGKCYLGCVQESDPFERIEPNNTFFNQNNLLVIKQIPKDQNKHNQEDLYNREVENLSTVSKDKGCQNLVKVFPYKLISDSSYYIVMEYCQNSSLDRYLNLRIKNKNYFSFYEFLQILVDLMSGYGVLKKAQIIHDDLKPDNIFIKNKYFKIGDFGLSFRMDKSKKNIRGGTQLYNAPQKYSNTIGSHKSDIYAMGIILFEILYGFHPYFISSEFNSYLEKQKHKHFQNNPHLYQQSHPRYQIEMRSLYNKIFLQYLTTRSIRLFNPKIVVPQHMSETFQKVNQLVYSMCDLSEKTRPGYQYLIYQMQCLKLQNIISREDLFLDLSELSKTDFQFNLQNLTFQSESDVQMKSIKQSYSKSICITSQNLNQKVNFLKKHMIETNNQIKIFSEILYTFSLRPAEGENEQWQKAIFQSIVSKYVFLLNHQESLYVRQRLTSLTEEQLNQFYQKGLDCFLKIFKQNEEYLQNLAFTSAVYDHKVLIESRVEVLKLLQESITDIVIDEDTFENFYSMLLLYKILKSYEKVKEKDSKEEQVEINKFVREEMKRMDRQEININYVEKEFKKEGFCAVIQFK